MAPYPTSIEDEMEKGRQEAKWNAFQVVMEPILRTNMITADKRNDKIAELRRLIHRFDKGKITFEDEHRAEIMRYFE